MSLCENANLNASPRALRNEPFGNDRAAHGVATSVFFLVSRDPLCDHPTAQRLRHVRHTPLSGREWAARALQASRARAPGHGRRCRHRGGGGGSLAPTQVWVGNLSWRKVATPEPSKQKLKEGSSVGEGQPARSPSSIVLCVAASGVQSTGRARPNGAGERCGTLLRD
jgi:hypothetical protein